MTAPLRSFTLKSDFLGVGLPISVDFLCSAHGPDKAHIRARTNLYDRATFLNRDDLDTIIRELNQLRHDMVQMKGRAA